ncbi:hypothetical protein BEU23_21445 [Bacillus anthracis]|nr:hypothetical protein U368_26350 [Bacillus anthracis 8903-G]EVT95937.1 hypothetical protein U365_25765 [Bacillus anthracis 9080-G]EVU03019.1 hypothetical protein U369_26545 [Bacillus anthracis 52-G]EXJ18006.1 hypothetical protein Y693_26270 [Bacillus anthracis str. 95014]OPE87192.1 hypothetical protein BEU25_21075 [Bacillus anthracis]
MDMTYYMYLKNRVSRGRKYILLPFSMYILSKTLPNICSFFRFFMGIRGKIIIQIFMRNIKQYSKKQTMIDRCIKM